MDTLQTRREIVKPLTPDEKLRKLEIEHVFWKNRLQLAHDTTLDLIVDLIDSCLVLEIKGVPVRECKIHDYYIDQNLSELKRNPDVLKWLSQPFKLEHDWSNIPKEPIKINEIYSNDSTTENIVDFYKEDLPDIQVAFFFSRDLLIYIDHRDDGYPSDSHIFELMNKELAKRVKYLIKLKMRNSDVKAIYRSLSHESGLSLRF